MTEQQLRQQIVSIAQGWIGCKESNGTHKPIIDLYNSHKPLARGYTLKYTDAWCAGFASACAIKAGLTDIIPTEVGCEKYIALFKAMGIWEENDAYVPSPGDYVFYDWQDGTNYATTDNTGAADHVGIVEKVSGSTITVIEGNYSNAVQRRPLAVNGRYIRGYGVPKYSSKATAGSTSSTTTTPPPTTATGLKVGDVVNFSGTKHYSNAAAATGTAAKSGPAKITAISAGAKHPYHIIHTDSTSNVYGWVDAADISGAAGGSTVHTVVKGDTLSAIAARYGATVAAIVAANKSRYSTITANYIVVGWKLTIPQ